MDKALIQLALDTIGEKIKALQQAQRELKKQVSENSSKPQRQRKKIKPSQTDKIVQLFKDEGRALSTREIVTLIEKRGKSIPVASVRSLLNLHKDKIFKALDQQDEFGSKFWHLIELMEKEKDEVKK